MNVVRNLLNRIRGWLPKEPLSGQVKILHLTGKPRKPSKTILALSFVAISLVVFGTLSILQLLGLGFCGPFAAGAAAAITSAVLSIKVWKPRDQTVKSNEMG